MPVKQVERLVEAIAKRGFTDDVLVAQLEEVAIGRALASAFGAKSLPPWPKWDEEVYRKEPKKVSKAMGKFKTLALQD